MNLNKNSNPTKLPPKSFYSLDDGKSFNTSSRDFTYAAYDPFDVKGLRLLGFYGHPGPGNDSIFYESLDGGKVWHSYSPLPAEQSNLFDGKALLSSIVWDPINKKTVYESAASALVYKSTDNGKTWTKILSLDKL
ncbi:MAG: sialidase family protein [Thermoanaerobaculia bacterium]